ncbi:MAG: biotin carboxylase N-terminal domain-containing protein [Mycobacterium sp.]
MGFDTVLVANRGEIAVRVIRTLKAMGIRSVAVYSDADATARHVAAADLAVAIGPAPARDSYLNIPVVVDAAVRTGAQAVHPGYGFLSENADFAAALASAGVTFIGPPVGAIQTMGDKIAAKGTVSEFGVPVVPGIARPGLTDDELIVAADEIGYPVLVKPSAGGGGKGMRMVEQPADLPAALVSARRESAAAFGDDTLFLERFVLRPRHIEVQVLADSYGNVVHLGERECSLQRRHQKVIEEAPSPLLDPATRARIGAAACDTARSVDYTGAGTVEFIVSADRPDEFFFMEMNTRLQVEHPVTEMVTGWDLVEWQVRIAAGEKLTVSQADIALRGHAIEARVYAEDPARGFLPTGGDVLAVVEPHAAGVRVDSGLSAGMVVGSDYDPMLAKVVAHGADRAAALRALDRALADTAVLGVVTNVEFARFLLADPDVIAGRLDTGLLDRRAGDFAAAPASDELFIAAAAFHWLRLFPAPGADLWEVPSGWRVGDRAPVSIRLRAGERTDHVHITGSPAAAKVRIEDGESHSLHADLTDDRLTVTLGGLRSEYTVATADSKIWLAGGGAVAVLEEVREAPVRPEDEQTGDAELTSPMPGAVVAVGIEEGADVAAGTVVVTVEAMKMEHPLAAPADGVVELLVAVGDQVKVGQPLARIIVSGNAIPEAEDSAS